MITEVLHSLRMIKKKLQNTDAPNHPKRKCNTFPHMNLSSSNTGVRLVLPICILFHWLDIRKDIEQN